MQSNSGLLRWLKVPFLYNAFQGAVGGSALRRSLIEKHVRPKAGDKVIDIGCGPAQALRCLPDVEYLGLDSNPGYILFAYDALNSRARMICNDACWIPNQGAFSKYIMSHDRGRNIRTEQQYCQLAAKFFKNVDAWVDKKPMRIPYVTVVLECEK